MPNIIEVNHLVKYYPGGERPAVDDVSFAVRRGEIFGLLGPTGAGKTTVVAMLASLLKPTSGEATIAGFDLARQPNAIKRCSQFVPQRLILFPWLSVRSNLVLYGFLHGLSSRQLKQRTADALKVTGLGTCSTPRQISLAAALLHQPEILFLDEPTVGFDPHSSHRLLKAVVELNRRGLTVVYATRDGEQAARLCHRIALIDEGRIIALDTPRALQEMLGGDAARSNLDDVFLALTGKQLQG
jgi:ABC-2 type transport system ATP-binding protein